MTLSIIMCGSSKKKGSGFALTVIIMLNANFIQTKIVDINFA